METITHSIIGPYPSGNTDAASDLYGFGVRVGIYLQVIGMSLSCLRLKCSGLKLTCAASMFALLVSWSILVRKEDISPCEAWLVLTLISALLTPASAAVGLPSTLVGEGIATFVLEIAVLWLIIAYLVFWGKLYHTLPSLGTSGEVWVFVKVNIKHWFRTLMLVYGCVFMVPLLLPLVVTAPSLIAVSYDAYKEGRTKLDPSIYGDAENSKKNKKCGEIAVRIISGYGLLNLIFMIAAIEMIIIYNELTPEKSLTKPGQSIPLVIGVIVLLDGIAAVFGKERKDSHNIPESRTEVRELRQNNNF